MSNDNVIDATARIEAAQAEAAATMGADDQKKKEAQAMAALSSQLEWTVFEGFIDQIANRTMQQLMHPTDKAWQADYLRGILKGLDISKTLPASVVQLYTQQQNQAQQTAENAEKGEEQDNPEMRLDPEPEESK